MIRYLRKIVQSQKKLYLTMMMILTLLAAFEFVLLSLYSFSSQRDDVFLKLMPAITIFVSFFLTLIMNHFFIESKNEELSMILLSGSRIKEVVEYIVIQFGLLFFISDLIGFIVGIGLMFIVNALLPYYFLYDILEVLFVFLGIFICKIIYVFLLNFGKFVKIKLDVATYILHHSTKTSKPGYFSQYLFDEKHRFPVRACLLTLLALLLIALSIQGLFENEQDVLLPLYFIFFLSGEIIIIYITIPLIFDFCHDRKLMTMPKTIMVLANVMDLSKVLVSMINILACVMPICLSQFFMEGLDDVSLSVTMVCYYVFLIMMLLSFILRFQIYLPAIETDIATLKAIGYNFQQLKTIYNFVVLCFMIVVFCIPLILYILMLYRSYQLTYISLDMLIVLVVSYCVVFAILAIYMLHQYHQTVKEAYSDVKYLNRSE
ncbi:MAG: hypothetical protein ACI4SR_10645 [Faecalibacillus sp.]